MNCTFSVPRLNRHTLSTGRLANKVAQSRGSGCTSRKTAFQPGLRAIGCEIHCAMALPGAMAAAKNSARSSTGQHEMVVCVFMCGFVRLDSSRPDADLWTGTMVFVKVVSEVAVRVSPKAAGESVILTREA